MRHEALGDALFITTEHGMGVDGQRTVEGRRDRESYQEQQAY
jgi:hypothetical protein